MAQISRPWTGTTTGDAGAYSDSQWRDAWAAAYHAWAHGTGYGNRGPIIDSGNAPNTGLQVQATTPASTSVEVLPGAAVVEGALYLNDGTETLAIAANSSGNARIDTIVLRKDDIAQTVRLAVKQGTPAASPVPPALTQTAGTMWEIPLKDVAVANGFSSISNDNLKSREEWANAADGIYLKDILNNSGSTRETGDVMVWNGAANRAAATTTAFQDPGIAGVWVGRTADGAYGRMLVRGVGYVRTAGSVARGDILVSSTTFGAATVGQNVGSFQIGRALEARTGAGMVLAYIDILEQLPLAKGQTVVNEATDLSVNSGTFTNITGLAVTLTLSGARDVLVMFTVSYNYAISRNYAHFNVALGGVDQIADHGPVNAGHGAEDNCATVVYKIPASAITPGSNTIQARVRTDNTMTIYRGAGTANADVHPVIDVMELP